MRQEDNSSAAGAAPLTAGHTPKRFAYADPPYLGVAQKHYGHLHVAAREYDTPEAWQALIDQLAAYDGWALSLSSPSLRTILPMCPPDVRVLAWIKPFCSFKPGVGIAYAWEPIIVRGCRRRTRDQDTVRDWVAENITLRRGFTGAKPAAVVYWLLQVLNVLPGDEFDDLFPGSGAVTDALAGWRQSHSGHSNGHGLLFPSEAKGPAPAAEPESESRP